MTLHPKLEADTLDLRHVFIEAIKDYREMFLLVLLAIFTRRRLYIIYDFLTKAVSNSPVEVYQYSNSPL